MVREADGTYILEVYKDEKKTETKTTIVMDFCSEVVKVCRLPMLFITSELFNGTNEF